MLDVVTSVLISIKPQYCGAILNGEKNLELRKSVPKLGRPFKAYIYCTKPGERLLDIIRPGDDVYGETYKGDSKIFIKTPKPYPYWVEPGKIVGEAMVTDIREVTLNGDMKAMYGGEIPDGLYTRVTVDEFLRYRGKGHVYGWKLEDIRRYEKPVTLKWFGVSRPPQSWQYVIIDRSDAIRLERTGGTKEDDRTRIVLD